MKLFPLRMYIIAGNWRLLGITILQREDEDEEPSVSIPAPFGFSLPEYDVDEIDTRLEPHEEDDNGATEATCYHRTGSQSL